MPPIIFFFCVHIGRVSGICPVESIAQRLSGERFSLHPEDELRLRDLSNRHHMDGGTPSIAEQTKLNQIHTLENRRTWTR